MSKEIYPLKELPFFYITTDELFDRLDAICVKHDIKEDILKVYAENNECFGFVVQNITYCANYKLTELVNIALP